MQQGNKTLLESFFALFSMEVLGYVLGFVTFPYLTHVLGVEKFGLIGFAVSICEYFRLITTYSFYKTAPRDVAMASDQQELKKIFTSVFGAKLCLLGAASLLYAFVVCGVSAFYQNVHVYMALYFVLLGDALFPVWFFQGIEKMRFITTCNFIARMITTVAIFIFVQGPSDVAIAALCQSATTTISAVIALGILLRRYPFVFGLPKTTEIAEQLRNGWTMFWSGLAVNLYIGTDTVLLGFLTNNVVVGYYTGAQRLIEMGKKVINTSATAIFPRASALFKESQDSMEVFLRKWLKYLVMAGLLMGVIGTGFSDRIVYLILGDEFGRSIPVFRVMIWLPAVIAVTQIYLNTTMLIRGWIQEYGRVVLWGATTNLLIIFPLIKFYEELGVAIAMLATETIVMLHACYIAEKKGVRYLR